MREYINNFIHDGLPIIGILFLIVFASILLIRLIVAIWLYFAIKNYQAIKQKVNKNKTKLPPKKPHYNKADEELFRQKEELSPSKANSYEIIPSQQQEPEFERPQIVDIVKPVGFWTSMVLGQKLTYLVSSAKLMNENNKDKGFWTSMVEAQARAAGRERGKGRY